MISRNTNAFSQNLVLCFNIFLSSTNQHLRIKVLKKHYNNSVIYANSSFTGLLKEVQATYVPAVETLKSKKDNDSEAADLGDIKVDWTIQGDRAKVRQYSLVWRCHGDDSVQTKVVGPEVRSCTLPVQHRR